MKIFVLSFIIMTAVTFAKAQLPNSRWSGTLAVPQVSDVIIDFKADTMNIILMNTGDIIERSAYTVKNNVITMKKVSGGSPCDVGSVFTLTYTIKNNQLFIKVLSDPCTNRANSWQGEPFKKD